MERRIDGVMQTIHIVALQSCDDSNLYATSREDLQHNVGILAEWSRVTGMRMNKSKSSYVATQPRDPKEEGMPP